MPLRTALLLAIVCSAPAAAQFRKIDIAFHGVGCAPCIESLPSRIQRMRGVESAEVDSAKGILHVTLAGENRVRLELVRDAIEQDGTRTKWAEVEVRGEISKSDKGWRLVVPSGSAYALSGDVSAGVKTVAGRVEDPRAIVIAVRTVRE